MGEVTQFSASEELTNIKNSYLFVLATLLKQEQTQKELLKKVKNLRDEYIPKINETIIWGVSDLNEDDKKKIILNLLAQFEKSSHMYDFIPQEE